MTRITRILILVFPIIMLLTLALPAQKYGFSQASKNELAYFVHGISGLELGVDLENAVDAWVDDKKEAENVKFGEILGPYSIKPGTYDIELYKTGFGPDMGNSPVFEFSITSKAGATSLYVGHWTKDAKKMVVTRFPLDLSPIHDKKKSRVMITHCAAAPHLVAAFYDAKSATEHPYVGNEAMESTDKFVTEISKIFRWAFYVQEAVLDRSGTLLYDKLFKIKPQKAYMAVILGTPKTPSFRVVIKAHKKKLK